MASVACANHPAATAAFECGPCRRTLCASCVKILEARGKQMAMCLACGALAIPVDHHKAVAAKDAQRTIAHDEGLTTRIFGPCLAYLVEPGLLASLAGLAVVAAILSYGAMVGWIAMGLEAAVYFRIVQSAANGADTFDPPDFTDPWDEIVWPLLRYIAAALPLILAVWYAISTIPDATITDAAERPRMLLSFGGAVAVIAAVVLWPLLTVIAAIHRSSPSVLNPIMWARMLVVLKTDYLIAMFFVYAAFALQIFLAVPLAAALIVKLPVPFIGRVAGGFLIYLPMALRGRILGELCRPYME